MDAPTVLQFPARRIVVVLDVDPADALTPRQPAIVPPNYRCPLDKLIVAGQYQAWPELIRRLPYIVETMDRPSFRKRFPDCDAPLPLIGLAGGGEFEVLLESQNLHDASGLTDLSWQLEATLATRSPLPFEPHFAEAA